MKTVTVEDAKLIYQNLYEKWFRNADRYGKDLNNVYLADGIFRQLFGDDFRNVVREWDSEIQDKVYGEKNEKKIETKRDLNIPGWGFIPAKTGFKVDHFNKRFVYVKLNEGCTLRLARKSDCTVLY